MTAEPGTPGRGRWTLIALAALFIGPLASAWILYLGGFWQPGAGANRGQLLEPVLTLPRAAQPAVDGEIHEAGYLLGKWSIVHRIDGGCDRACAEALIRTRQVRLALGREIERIQRIVFVSGDTGVPGPEQHPDLLAVQLTGQAGEQIAAALARHGGDTKLYLVDPLGNLILGYALDAPPADLRDDLKKLLRLSRIG